MSSGRMKVLQGTIAINNGYKYQESTNTKIKLIIKTTPKGYGTWRFRFCQTVNNCSNWQSKYVKLLNPQVTDISPKQVTKDQWTTFTITGSQLPNDLAISLQDCENNSVNVNSSGTKATYSCIPRSAGSKNLYIKDGPGGTLVGRSPLTVTVVDVAVPTPTVSSISPLQATKGVATKFTVYGSQLPTTLAMSLEHANCGSVSVNSAGTSATISCDPQVSGNMNFYVKVRSGGSAISGSPLTVKVIDTSNFTWQQIKPNDGNGWSARSEHTSVVFNNKMWVIGGHSGGSCRNDVWSSSDGKNWTQETANASWSGRCNHTSTVFNNKIWVIGGADNSGRLNDVWSSSDGQSWTQEIANAPWRIRAYHTSIVFKNKIWVLGGHDGTISSADSNDVWSSSDGQSWTQEIANAPWTVRHDFASVVLNNKICIMGGDNHQYRNNNRIFGDVWCSSDGQNWTQKTANAPWANRQEFRSVIFSNKIWLIGGNAGITHASHNLKNDIHSSSDGKIWKQERAANWTARHYHQSLVFNNKIWVIGGYDGSNKLNDVWAFGDFSSNPKPQAPTNGLIAHYKFDNGFYNEVTKQDDGLKWQNSKQVDIVNGQLKLINRHDGDIKRETARILNTLNYSKITVEKRSKIIKKGSYSINSFGLNTYSKAAYDRSKQRLQVAYNYYFYSAGDNSSPTGAYTNRNHFYMGHGSTDINKNRLTDGVSNLLNTRFGIWIREKLTIDLDNKTVLYEITNDDGSNKETTTLTNIDFGRDDATHLYLSAWDWANGSEHIIDELKISVVKDTNKLNDDFTRDTATGIVANNVTNFQWQDDNNAKTIKRNFAGAKSYCANLSLNGHSDWRLPNRAELYTIIPALSKFSNTANGQYWSSSRSYRSAWSMSFPDGYGSRESESNSYFVRCLRYN